MKNNTKDMVILSLFSAIIVLMTFTPLGYIPWIVKITLIQIPVIVGSVILGPKKGAMLGFIFGLTSLINNTINPGLTSFFFVPWYSLTPEVKTSWLSLIICFVPRILVGVIPYYTEKFLRKRGSAVKYAVMGAIGTILYLLFGNLMRQYIIGREFIVVMGIAFIVLVGLFVILSKSKRGDITYAVTGAVGAFTNTLFFLIFVWLIFGRGNSFGASGVLGKSFMDFVIGIVTVNGCLEIIASMICVSAILMATTRRKR